MNGPFKLLYQLLARAGVFGLFVDDPNAPSPSPTPPAPAPAPRSPEPEHFSKEYVRELREENKGWRLKASEHEAAAKAAKEQADRAAAEAQTKITEATTAAEKRVIRAELKAEALKAGMIDLDGLQLADLSGVKLDEQGNVTGGAEAIEALKKSKPYLFGQASTSSTSKPPPTNPPANKKATEMSPEEYAAAKAAALKQARR